MEDEDCLGRRDLRRSRDRAADAPRPLTADVPDRRVDLVHFQPGGSYTRRKRRARLPVPQYAVSPPGPTLWHQRVTEFPLASARWSGGVRNAVQSERGRGLESERGGVWRAACG